MCISTSSMTIATTVIFASEAIILSRILVNTRKNQTKKQKNMRSNIKITWFICTSLIWMNAHGKSATLSHYGKEKDHRREEIKMNRVQNEKEIIMEINICTEIFFHCQRWTLLLSRTELSIRQQSLSLVAAQKCAIYIHFFFLLSQLHDSIYSISFSVAPWIKLALCATKKKKTCSIYCVYQYHVCCFVFG